MISQFKTRTYILKQLRRLYAYGQCYQVDLTSSELRVAIQRELTQALLTQAGLAGYDGFVGRSVRQIFS